MDVIKKRQEIINWLDHHGLKDYYINNDFTVDIGGDVDLSNRGYVVIPIKFNRIFGSLNCSHNQLTSLEFAPYYITGNFDCSFNNITSLEHAPKNIKGTANYSNNKIDSLANDYSQINFDEKNKFLDCLLIEKNRDLQNKNKNKKENFSILRWLSSKF